MVKSAIIIKPIKLIKLIIIRNIIITIISHIIQYSGEFTVPD